MQPSQNKHKSTWSSRWPETVAIISLLSVLAACGGGSGGAGETEPPQNRPPTLGGVRFTTQEDLDLSSRIMASDPDGDALTFALKSNPTKGSLVSFDASGAFTYRPAADASGTDSFGVSATDSDGNVVSGTVTVTILAVNDAPRGQSLVVQTAEDTAATDQVVATDVEGDELSFTLQSPPANGTVTNVRSDGSFRYIPAQDYFGTDQFELRVSDSSGAQRPHFGSAIGLSRRHTLQVPTHRLERRLVHGLCCNLCRLRPISRCVRRLRIRSRVP